MADRLSTSDEQASRRAFLRKSLVAGGIVAAAPVVTTANMPAGAQVTSTTTESLSFTIGAYSNNNPATQTVSAPDGTSAPINGGATCVLAGYEAGVAPVYGGSATATRTNGSAPETGSVTLTGLPSAGTCAVSVLARCGPDGSGGACATGSAVKADGQTSVTVSGMTSSCSGNTGFRKFYVTVTC